MVITDEQIAQLILSVKRLDPEKIKELLHEAKETKTSLSELLIQKDFVTDENLGLLIADAFKLPFVSLSKISIPADVLEVVPEVVARKQQVLAFGRDKNGLKVAMANPGNKQIRALIEKKSGEKVIPYYATEHDIISATKLYQQELQKSFDELVEAEVDRAKRLGGATAAEVPISKIVDLLIQHAQRNKTSDIHIEPDEDKTFVRFRIDGILHDVLKLPEALHDQLVARVKVLGRLRTDEHLSAQDGKIHTEVDGLPLDVRVSIVPIVDGEKVVMRLLAAQARQLSLLDLGLSQHDYAKVLNGFTKPHGMVLSTGPTGSGKSTSIYAMLKIVNTREINIATIEDPVEYDIPGINQIQVNNKTNLTFANGLRAILRQDPDVIFVGEIRDEETAGIAINSAMTGHLVFSTLHTNDAATTLPRLIDMNIEPFLVASTVNVIIGQRLVRKICEKCRFSQIKKAEDFVDQLPKWLLDKYFAKRQEMRIYQGKGCPVCHETGYKGRIGIFEVLEVTEAIRTLIIGKAAADSITAAAVKEGMTTMMEDGLHKVEQGLTTVEELLRATKG